MAVFLPACRRSEAPPTVWPPRAGWVETACYKKPGPWVIGRSGRGDTTAWMVMLSAHIEYGIKEKYRAAFRDYFSILANWDPNKQIEDIESLLAQKIDLLLIDPMDHAAVKAGVERAMQAGVPVILASTRVRSEQYVSWVSTDEEERGAACADWLCDRVPKGHIVVMASTPAAGDENVWLVALRRRIEAYSHSRQLTVLRCPWSSLEAQKALAAVLKSAPVDGVIVNNGVLGRGAVQAFVDHGAAIPPLAGADDWNGWLRTAKEYNVHFFALSGGANLGLRCVELAMQVLSGQAVPRYMAFPYETFDEAALDRYYRPDLSDHYWAINDLPSAWIEKMFKP